jgi:hypothetical protein
LSATEECALKPKDSFRECANSPELVPFLRDGWQCIPETWVTHRVFCEESKSALKGV